MARALRRALAARAKHVLGPDATADDYILRWVSQGFDTLDLTRALAINIRHPTLNRRTVDALISPACRAQLQRIRKERDEKRRAAADRQAALDVPDLLDAAQLRRRTVTTAIHRPHRKRGGHLTVDPWPAPRSHSMHRAARSKPVESSAVTKTDRIIAALTTRAGVGATAIDFVEDHIGSGGTLLDLAAELTVELGENVRRDTLSRLVYDLEGARDRLPEARRRGADALVEQARQIIDEAPTDSREALAKGVKKAEVRQWIAERANSGAWGGQKAVTQVKISLQSLHLDALRKFNRSCATATALPAAEVEFEVIAEG